MNAYDIWQTTAMLGIFLGVVGVIILEITGRDSQ